MFTKENFLSCDISDRAALVWDLGEYVGTRDYYGYKVMLYVLPKLYVEVWYFNNKIEKVQPIENEKSLNHYLKDINILSQIQ